jgi:hypothetical protein
VTSKLVESDRERELRQRESNNSNNNSNMQPRTTATSAGSTVVANPLEDAAIRQMLHDAKSKIGTPHDFAEWQASFLHKFHVFLDTDGSARAQKAYASFRQASKGLIHNVKHLQSHIDAGTISETRISVKGRNSMSELKVVLDKLTDGLQLILPTTQVEIQTFGFSKFHMAAVLVKDGFKEYAVLEYCRLLLQLLRVAALDKAAGSTILHQIDVFGNQFDVFCGVLASLHILDLAVQTSALLHADLHKETQKIQVETKKLKEEKGILAASSHHSIVQHRGGGGGRGFHKNNNKNNSSPASADDDAEDEASFGGGNNDDDDDTVSSYETIGYEQEQGVASVASSYESIEEIQTVSSYETIVQDDDDESSQSSASSYETIEIHVPSDYETVQEEIEVSDYESDQDNGNDNGSSAVTDNAARGNDDDKNSLNSNNNKKSSNNKSKSSSSSTTTSAAAAGAAATAVDDNQTKKELEAAKKKEAAAERARKKFEQLEKEELEAQEPKVKPAPKQLPMDPRCELLIYNIPFCCGKHLLLL